jgi:enoyl-CoA hydratase/carnithine racemase
MTYQRLNVTLQESVAVVELNRPGKANALDLPMWHELREAMRWLDATPAARVGVLRGAGTQFTAGIDLALSPASAPRSRTPATGARGRSCAA